MAGAELMQSGLTLKRWFWRGFFVLHFVIAVFAEEVRIKAKMGEEAFLPCCHKKNITESSNDYRVYWQKENNKVVLAYSNGVLVLHSPEYVNRTKMDQNNLTLTVNPVELSDKDKYECIVQRKGPTTGFQKHCSMTVILDVVVDYSKPVMSADVQSSCGSSQVTVTCSSYGGYPSPRISGVLNNDSVEWRTEVSDTSPYNITATLQFNVTDDSTLTCTIEYDDFEVSSNYTLRKQKECSQSSHGVIIACLVLICIFLLAITLLLKCVWCRDRRHEECNHHPVPQDPAVVAEMKESIRDDFCEVTLEPASA